MLEGGLRLKGVHKEQSDKKPLVTVVTVVFNGASTIENTMLSVLGQTYNNIEYIIVDGASKDNTIDIVRKHENKIDYFISEPDKGIYDAMNKSIMLAKGSWIIFMNSGDVFYDSEVVEKVFSNPAVLTSDLVYGSCEVLYDWQFSRVVNSKDGTKLWKEMICCHQSLFSKTEIMKKYMFNISNKLCADYEFLAKCYKDNCKFKNVNMLVSTVTAGGVSDTKRTQVWREKLRIARSNHLANGLLVTGFYLYKIIKEHIKNRVKGILPDKLVHRIIRAKNQI